MRQAGLWLAATALSASLVAGGPVIATATAAPGGGHGHGGAGHAGGAGRGSSHAAPGGGAASAAAVPGGGRVNPGSPTTAGSGAPVGADTGGSTTNIGRGPGWSHGATPPKPGQSAAPKPAQSPINGGLEPLATAKAEPVPTGVRAQADDETVPTAGSLSATLPDSVLPTQTVAVTVAITRTMTISLVSKGDSRSSIDTQPLSMSVPGVVPVWWAADSEDLWNGFYGFAVLVLLPLVGVGLGLCLLAGLRRTYGGADSL